ncbi:hypothetical protein ACP70R_001947 [Stipagrostis hirtigluma subsp. patula]
METARKQSPMRDLYPVRPPVIPGYMAATQSARLAPQAAARAHIRSRSGSVAPSGGSTGSWSSSL